MATIVFHLPYRRDDTRVDASIARPTYLIDAFREQGHEVIEISGLARDRRRGIRDLRLRLRRGDAVDYLYSESHSIPNVIANWKSSRVLQGPLLDYSLFRLARKHGIPTALFLRDITWRNGDFMSHRPRAVRRVVKLAYRWDLVQYRLTIDVLYLPSEPMRALVPIYPQERMKILRAAGQGSHVPVAAAPGRPPGPPRPLTVIYVGNMDGNHYQFHRLFEAAQQAPELVFVVNVPEVSWSRFGSQYEQFLGANITIRHESFEGINDLMACADVGVLFYEHHEYRSIAFPAKIFEYCRFGLPIVSDDASFAGEYVERNGIGWATPYDAVELVALLRRLAASPEEVARVAARAREHADGQTWSDRVDQVIADLSALRR